MANAREPLPLLMQVGVSPGRRYVKYNRTLGKGTFKSVYFGVDTITMDLVAWAEPKETRTTQMDFDSFREEAELLETLNHDNILQFHHFWYENPFSNVRMVMITEYMESRTLRSHVKNLKEMKLSSVKSWSRQVLSALSYLHDRPNPIIHRDIKCNNLFYSAARDLVKIADFGLFRIMTNNPVRALAGTPGFQAPEIFQRHYDQLVDIYAFGMSVLEIATSHVPYIECYNKITIRRNTLSGIKPASLNVVPHVDVKEFIMQCTRKMPDRPTAINLLQSEFLTKPTVGDVAWQFPDNSILLHIREHQRQELATPRPRRRSI